jgi:hypothetical protein
MRVTGVQTCALPISTLTATNTTSVTLPTTGTLATLAGTEALTNKTISGSNNTLSNIANASLTNSAITINGNSVSLGGSTTVTATATNALTIGTGLSGGSYNGSSAVTITIDSTVATLTGVQTLTNKTISGASNTLSNIGNGSLTNSAVTINGNSVSLGGSTTVTATASNALTIGTGLSGGSYNGSSAVTVAIDSTVATLTGSQTLTNKTLTSPTMTAPVLGTPASGNLANCTFPTLNQNTTGTAAGLSATLAVASGGTGVTTSTGSGSTVLSASPTFTGTPAAPTASAGTNTTQLATTAFVQTAVRALYPVGSIYINATNATNPGTLLGFGTWVAFGAGRVPVGFDSGNALFDTAEETGGTADAIIVSHTHTFSGTTSTRTLTGTITNQYTSGNTHGTTTGVFSQTDVNVDGDGGETRPGRDIAFDGTHDHTVSGTTGSTGISGINFNYQPYITVYMWKRTA